MRVIIFTPSARAAAAIICPCVGAEDGIDPAKNTDTSLGEGTAGSSASLEQQNVTSDTVSKGTLSSDCLL